MTAIKFSERHLHGLQREQMFRDYINSRKGWSCHETGQNVLTEFQRQELQNDFLAFDSKLSVALLNHLPSDVRTMYVQRLKDTSRPGIPCEGRFEPDAQCIYNNSPAFQAEIKTDMGDYPNITYCLAGFIWSCEADTKPGTHKIFIFDVDEDVAKWRYLFMDQIVSFTTSFQSGEGMRGSCTPHGRVSKAKLKSSTQHLSNLLSYFETVEF